VVVEGLAEVVTDQSICERSKPQERVIAMMSSIQPSTPPRYAMRVRSP